MNLFAMLEWHSDMVLVIIRVSSRPNICRPEEERMLLIFHVRFLREVTIATPSSDKSRLHLIFVIHEYAALLQSPQL